MYHLFRILLILILAILFSACRDTPAVLTKAEQLMETAPDSALQLLKTTRLENFYLPSDKALYALLYCQALDKNDIKIESDSLITIATNHYDKSDLKRAGYSWFYQSRIANNRGDANERALNLIKAQEFAEKIKDDGLMGLVYIDKGEMYKTQNQTDSSISYFQKSYLSFKKINDTRNCIINLLNIGTQYLAISKFENALNSYLLAEKFAIEYNDKILTSAVYRCLGSLYLKQDNYYKSLYYYQKVPQTEFEIYNSNKWCLQANIYVRSNKTDSARICLNNIKELKGIEIDYYNLWKNVYLIEKNYLQAFKYASKTIEVTDSLYKQNLDISFAGMEKKYNYQKYQLDNRELKLKDSKKSVIILIILLLLSGGIIGFLFWRNNIKHKQLLIEKELSKQETLRAEKEHENTLLLEKQLKLHKIVVANLDQYRKNALKQPAKINAGFSPIENSDFNEELIAAIDLEYNNFTKRLAQQFNNLSSTDILICCLLLANFDTGMISSILGIKIASVNIKRSRLRHKLQINNSVNLLDYLRCF